MSYFMVDVESDGPIPGDYSMVCFAAVIVEDSLGKTYYGRLRPISGNWIPEALKISGFSRADCMNFENPEEEIGKFRTWILENTVGAPMFISDNNGYDWSFVNWYFHHFAGSNPFGHSSTNLGSLYKGIVKDVSKNFKHLRKTAHTHDPLDDVMGNAQALLALRDEYGLSIALE